MFIVTATVSATNCPAQATTTVTRTVTESNCAAPTAAVGFLLPILNFRLADSKSSLSLLSSLLPSSLEIYNDSPELSEVFSLPPSPLGDEDSTSLIPTASSDLLLLSIDRATFSTTNARTRPTLEADSRSAIAMDRFVEFPVFFGIDH